MRWLWNIANEQRLLGVARTRAERRYYTAFDQINQLTELRSALPWLADVPRDVSAQVLVELDRAWQRSFLRLSCRPRWKRRGKTLVGFTEPHPKAFRIGPNQIRFPKIGALRAVVHRAHEGMPRSCTLRRDGDQWFVSIMCAIDVAEPSPHACSVLAIDRGVTNTLADSDGNITANPRFYERAMKRLAHAQRVVARRRKGSKNREKAKARVAKLHQKVRRQREHFLHVESARIAKSHGVVVIEKLNVAGMVRGNRGVARGIACAGWSSFAWMLKYKLEWSGGVLVEVPAAYSSQTCAACGCVDKSSRGGELFWCTGCGHIAHADVNAARVLKQRFEAPGNPWCLPVEGSVPKAARRSRKAKGCAYRAGHLCKVMPHNGVADYGVSPRSVSETVTP